MKRHGSTQLTEGQEATIANAPSYSDYWLTDQEAFEAGLGPDGDCDKNSANYKFWGSGLGEQCQIKYQLGAPAWEFAVDLFEQLAYRNGLSMVFASHSKRATKTYIVRDKALPMREVIFGRKQVSEAYDKFGIAGVYTLALYAFVMVHDDVTGMLRSPNVRQRETAILAGMDFPLSKALGLASKTDQYLFWLKDMSLGIVRER